MGLVELTVKDMPDGEKAFVLCLKVERVGLGAHPADIKAAILEELEGAESGVVLLDLGELRYSGTDFFAVLLGIQKRLTGRDQKLRVCNMDPAIEESLRMCMLHKIMDIYPSVAQALA